MYNSLKIDISLSILTQKCIKKIFFGNRPNWFIYNFYRFYNVEIEHFSRDSMFFLITCFFFTKRTQTCELWTERMLQYNIKTYLRNLYKKYTIYTVFFHTPRENNYNSILQWNYMNKTTVTTHLSRYKNFHSFTINNHS